MALPKQPHVAQTYRRPLCEDRITLRASGESPSLEPYFGSGSIAKGGRQVNVRGSGLYFNNPKHLRPTSRHSPKPITRSTLLPTYAQALARFEGLVLRESAEIAAHGKSQILTTGGRSPNAAVLLHGMSASPMQFAQLAEQLYKRGFNVLVPRLPRHGHRDRLSEEMGSLTADELREATVEAVQIARGLGERVTVVGFSLGGLLSSWAAQFEKVHRVVSVAPFFGPLWMPFGIGDVVATLTLKLPNRFQWWDPIKKGKQLPEHGYPRYSTHAVAQTYKLINDVFAGAAQEAPAAENIVMVTNKRETAISNRAVRRLVNHWKRHKPRAVETYEFRDLPFSHDIIEPLRAPAIVAKVYPVLLGLIDR